MTNKFNLKVADLLDNMNAGDKMDTGSSGASAVSDNDDLEHNQKSRRGFSRFSLKKKSRE